MTQKFLNTTTHSVSWVYKRHQDDELELKPPFQRNPVWSDAQKSYLIDTILNGFPIPELYIQEFTDASGNDRHVVVDGQQRLRSCIEFIENKFSLTGNEIGSLDGLSFDDMSPDQRQIIFNYNFVVRKLPDMDDDDLKAIFKRINKNTITLNPQELRHSTYSGQFITLMEDTANDERWADFNVFTSNDVRRMLDIEFISELSIGVLHGPQNKKSTLDRWYAAYEIEFERKSQLRTSINKILGEISTILPGLGKTRWRKKSDFYTLFLVLSEQESRLPFSREERDELGNRLIEFAAAVDGCIANPDQQPVPPPTVRAYTVAVERAASDLGNRRSRALQLKRYLGWAVDADATEA
jgi:hypothetical protein